MKQGIWIERTHGDLPYLVHAHTQNLDVCAHVKSLSRAKMLRHVLRTADREAQDNGLVLPLVLIR